MLKNADKSKGFLIDGYPREVPQARKFEELVNQSLPPIFDNNPFVFRYRSVHVIWSCISVQMMIL
jgi:Adenylate kinase